MKGDTKLPTIPSGKVLYHAKPRRRAVVVGCTYQGHFKEIPNRIEPLLGTSNDAYAFALTLVNLFEFHPNNICLLTDAEPADCYSVVGIQNKMPLDSRGLPINPQVIPRDGKLSKNVPILPTRHNILIAMNWLINDCVDGDVLVFYFAGYGVQLDNLSGWEGEGYDEAIVPHDYRQNKGQLNAIPVSHIRDVLCSPSCKVQVSVFTDACGVQSLLDATGAQKQWTNSIIKGAKKKGIWPVQNVTSKMLLAEYDPSIFRDPQIYDRYARARYIPGEEVENTKELRDFMLQRLPGIQGQEVKAFHMTSSQWSEIAIECCVPSIGIKGYDHNGVYKGTVTLPLKPVMHGVFTYTLIHALHHCLHRALSEHKIKKITFGELFDELMKRHQCFQKSCMKNLQQTPGLTVYTYSASNPSTEHIFWPFGRQGIIRPYSYFTPTIVKRAPVPYIPDPDQWCTSYYCQSILVNSGQDTNKNRHMSPARPVINKKRNLELTVPDTGPPVEAGDGKFAKGAFSERSRPGLCTTTNRMR